MGILFDFHLHKGGHPMNQAMLALREALVNTAALEKHAVKPCLKNPRAVAADAELWWGHMQKHLDTLVAQEERHASTPHTL